MKARRLAELRFALAVFSSAIALACSDGTACGNKREIWIHLVVPERCAECVQFEFSSPILEDTSFSVREIPDIVIGQCEIDALEIRGDGAALLLSRAAYERVAGLRDSRIKNGQGELAALRIGGEDALFAVLHVEDLRRRVPLFDFESENEVEQFAQALGAVEGSVVRAAAPELDGPIESMQAREADRLLEELDRDDPILERLRDAAQGGADDDALHKIIDELDQP